MKKMLRKNIKSWKEVDKKLSTLLVYEPTMEQVEGFYTEEFEFFITNSSLYIRHGVPTTIINMADYFISTMRDLFRHALKEEQYKILALIDKAVDCQFIIFNAHAEIFCADKEMKKHIIRLLLEIRSEYDQYKVKQLKNF